MNRLPLKTKLIYAMGNLGIAIITVMHMLYMVYFFFPPKDSGIPYFIPQSSFIFGLTILGLIISVGKIVDAFFDPIIANFSDRLNHRLGKRIPMMRLAALPFALCYLSVFFVPVADGISTLNVVWLTCFLLMSAIFFTCYMIPFYSLMVDIAKSSNDKVDLGTISSAFWFVGFLIVSFTPALWDVFASLFETTKLWGLKITFSLTATLGFICLMIPALFIDEKKFASPATKRNDQPLFHSLGVVLKNRNFRYYLATNTCYNIATVIFESGLIYFVTVLALMEASIQGPLTTAIGVLTLACYPFVNKFAKTKGKSFILKISLTLFALTFFTITSFGIEGIHIYVLFGMVVLLSPFAQAAFGILPLVMTSDCAANDKHKTGEDRTGMYVAANGFCVKFGAGLGLMLFTSLLLFGKDPGDDLGIRLATAFGGLLALIGIILISQYNEQEVLAYNKAETDQSPSD